MIATASARNRGFLRGLGADEVIDYGSVRAEEVVSGVDVMVKTRGGEDFHRLMGTLRPGGSGADCRRCRQRGFLRAFSPTSHAGTKPSAAAPAGREGATGELGFPRWVSGAWTRLLTAALPRAAGPA
jgi:hypothetical protein